MYRTTLYRELKSLLYIQCRSYIQARSYLPVLGIWCRFPTRTSILCQTWAPNCWSPATLSGSRSQFAGALALTGTTGTLPHWACKSRIFMSNTKTEHGCQIWPSNCARMTQNEINLGLLKISFLFILIQRAKMNWKLILRSLRFEPSGPTGGPGSEHFFYKISSNKQISIFSIFLFTFLIFPSSKLNTSFQRLN